MAKKVIYIDLDNTVADYLRKAAELGINPNEAKHVEGFFRGLNPMKGAVEAYEKLSKHFDVYFLTTIPWSNPNAFIEKLEWIKEYFPTAYKNVITSHHKNLNCGEYLIDDSDKNGANEFNGKHIKIHSNEFPTWTSVVDYIFEKEK